MTTARQQEVKVHEGQLLAKVLDFDGRLDLAKLGARALKTWRWRKIVKEVGKARLDGRASFDGSLSGGSVVEQTQVACSRALVEVVLMVYSRRTFGCLFLLALVLSWERRSHSLTALLYRRKMASVWLLLGVLQGRDERNDCGPCSILN